MMFYIPAVAPAIFPRAGPGQGRSTMLDALDRALLDHLQRDAAWSFERLGRRLGLSKTAVWNRLQRLQRDGFIRRQVALLDADRLGLAETVFVAIRTARHSGDWLRRFTEAVADMPEIVEAHRLTGDVDYLLKVRVANTRAFDAFYKRLIERIDLFNVTSSLSMETLKETTALAIPGPPGDDAGPGSAGPGNGGTDRGAQPG
jgi:Lrp/AsnC family transcriptional regulator